MTQPNPVNYQLASDLVQAGAWRVDASLGLVYGKKGQPFRRTNSWGYVQIKFRDPQDWRTDHAALAHRVIWESVHGPLADGLTINHRNGDKQDNRLINLEAVTQGENVRHAYATGLNAGRPRTHCKRGHPLSGDNLYVRPDRSTSKGCRTCRSAATRRSVERRMAA